MDKETRKVRWAGEMDNLDTILDSIPFTATQRRNIDINLRELEELFAQANNDAN